MGMRKKMEGEEEEEEERHVIPHTFTMVCNMLQWSAIDSKVSLSKIVTMAVTEAKSSLEFVHQGQNWCSDVVVALWVTREYVAARLWHSKSPKRIVRSNSSNKPSSIKYLN